MDDEEHNSSVGQAEFIVSKHRNGGLDNIRMKLLAIWEFEDLQSSESGYEFQSKMNNTDSTNSLIDPLPGPNDA